MLAFCIFHLDKRETKEMKEKIMSLSRGWKVRAWLAAQEMFSLHGLEKPLIFLSFTTSPDYERRNNFLSAAEDISPHAHRNNRK